MDIRKNSTCPKCGQPCRLMEFFRFADNDVLLCCSQCGVHRINPQTQKATFAGQNGPEGTYIVETAEGPKICRTIREVGREDWIQAHSE